MKRKTFILSACIAVATIPLINYTWLNILEADPLSHPDELSRFCDEKVIREIGISYRRKFPEEKAKEELIKLLLSNNSGKEIKSTDKSMVVQLLNNKIHAEFSEYKTIIINGWVISLTEARQCALFSLT